MLTEIIYIQAENIDVNTGGSTPNLVRTRELNQEQTGASNDTLTGRQAFDEFGLRPDYTGEGASGSWGYLDINGSDTGPQASTTFTAPAGTYAITLRLANGATGTNSARPISLTVDGQTVQVANTNTSQFYMWELRTVQVTVATDGEHTLVFSQVGTVGAPNIDAIAIHNVGEVPNFSLPTFETATTFDIDENTTAVGSVEANDVANDTSGDAPARAAMVYAITGGTDAGAFAIDTATGELSLIEAADYETKTSYDVVVSATDAEGGTTEQAITVNVQDLDDGPDAFPSAADGADTTDEDTVVVIDVADLIDDIEDGEPTVIAATSSAGVVTIDGTNLTFTPDADFDGIATIAYTVEDSVGQQANGEIEVTVNPVNDAPTLDGTLDDVTVTDEVGTTVDLAALLLADVDNTQGELSFGVRLAGGDPAPAGVVVDGTTLTIPAGLELGTLDLEVFASDGALEAATVVPLTVTVEEAVFVPFETIFIQAEDGVPGSGNSAGTQVRDDSNPELNGNRPDYSGTGYVDFGQIAGDSFNYAFSDSEGGARTLHVRYASNGNRPLDVLVNGVSIVADPINATPFLDTDPDGPGSNEEGFDHWEYVTFEITTTVGQNTVSLVLPTSANAPNVDALAIAKPGEPVGFFAPEITSGDTFAIDENTTAVGQVTATDLDGNDLSFAVGGTDGDLFDISESGELFFLAAPDFENPADDGGDNTYDVTVTVSDGVDVTTQDISVTVGDVDEDASGIVLAALAFDENVAGASVATVTVEDPDTAYSAADLSLSGVDAAQFRLIDGDTGIELALAEGVELDFEAGAQPSVVVTLGGLESDPFTPAPADVDEPATAITLTPVAAAENALGAIVADVAVADPENTPYTAADFSLSGEDAGLFELVDGPGGVQLKLKDTEALDFEASAQPSVTVTLGGDLESAPFSPTVTDVDEEEPSSGIAFTALAAYSSQNGAGSAALSEEGTVVTLNGNLWQRAALAETATISAGTKLAVTIAVGPAMPEVVAIGFDINSALSDNQPGVYQLAGTQGLGNQVTDLRGQGTDNGDGTITFMIDLSAIAGTQWTSMVFVADDDAPGNGIGSVTFSDVQLIEEAGITLTALPFDENVAGASVATVTVDDDGTHTAADFSLSGAEAAQFRLIDGATGIELALAEGVELDFESVAQPSVVVTLDGAQSAPFTPAPADVEEPATGITLTAVPAAENIAGAVVADVAVVDPENTPYSAADLGLSGEDAALFELIDGPGGVQLKLKDSQTLDFEASEQPSVTVTLGGDLESAAFSPTVIDINEDAPSGPIVFGTIFGYSNQDRPQDGGTGAALGEGGTALTLDGNLWKRAMLPETTTITEGTKLAVTIELGSAIPEVVAIGFDANNVLSDNNPGVYQLAGTQGLGKQATDLRGQGIDNGDGTFTFMIDLSPLAGSQWDNMVFIADDDAAGNGLGSVTFSNVQLIDEPPVNAPPREVGGGVADFTVDEGSALEIDLPFLDDDGDPITFGFSVVDQGGNTVAVPGLEIVDGVLVGPAPGTPGVYTIVLTADDGVQGHVPTTSEFVLTVENVNDAPEVDTPALEPYFFEAGEEIDGIDLEYFRTYFSDEDNDPLTLSAEDLPEGLTVTDGVIVGTPTSGGDYTVTIRATDPFGESASLTIDLQIDGVEVGDTYIVEAEDFTGLPGTSKFFATGQVGASGEQIIRAVSGNTGVVTTDLTQNGLDEGWYQVSMTRYDETDASATYSLQVGNVVLASNAAFDGVPNAETENDTFDNDGPRGGAGQVGNLKTIVYETPVYITAGTLMALSGVANGELLRIDKFTFTRIESPNLAPSAAELDNATVAENAEGAVIGTLSATDPDGDDAAIVFSADPASDFEVVDGQLKLKEGVALDYESGATVDVDVTATDAFGTGTVTTLTVTVGDVDEAPSAPVLTNATVDENADGAVIGTVSSLDPEGTAVSFSVDDARFQIDGDDQLTLNTGESLDFEAGETVSVQVTATDETGQTTVETLEITVNDLNDAPTLTDPTAIDVVAVANGAGASIDLTVLGATDEDAGDTVTYVATLATGTPLPAGFEVVGTDLIVPTDAPTGTYEIAVFANDGELDSESAVFTVTVGEPAPFETIILQAEDFTLLNPVGDANPNVIRTETQNWERDGSPLNPEPNTTPANPGGPEFNDIGLRPDYSGDGYLDIQGTDTGAQAEVSFTAPAGTYEVTVRLANGTAPRPMSFDVDGVTATLSDTQSGAWYTWVTQSFTIEVTTDGQHTLTVSQDGTTGAPNIDAIAIALPGTPVDFLPDTSADEDGNFDAAPEAATVDVEDLATTQFRLSGVDADIVTVEASTDGGTTFAEVTPTVDGEDQIVTVDLSAFAAAETAEVTFRLTDNAGNTVTDAASIAIGEPIVVDPIVIQAEDNTQAIVDDVGEGGQGEVTREVNPQNPDDFGNYRPGGVGDAYIDFGSNPGDKLTFSVDAPVAGTYTVAFRYTNGDGGQLDRPLDLSVNGGTATSLAFPFTPGTEPWEAWSDFTVEIELTEGANTVSLEIPAGGINGPNIDQAVFTYADTADTSADEDGNLAVSAAAVVDPDNLDAVVFTLAGVDTDIVGYEASLDGGATFSPVTPANGQVTLDLSAFAAETSLEVIFRVTDDADNTATTSATIAIDDVPEPFLQTIQLETRDGSVTIIDDTGGGTNNQNMTQIRDPQNPEPVDAEKGPDGLWDGFNGAGFLDMGLNVGDAFAFDIDAPAAGTYTLTFRYGNGGATDRPMSIDVGGSAAGTLAFSSTTDWDNWVETSIDVTLVEGVNTITVANTIATGPNLDQVVISNNVEPEDPTPEPGLRETIKINFQDGTAPKAEGYLVGNFTDYGLQSNGLTYGFVTEASAIDADGTTNTPTGSSFPAIAINERSGSGTLPDDGTLGDNSLTVNFDSYDPRLTGYAHFDLGSFPTPVGWEIELDNGWYEVTVSVGDTGGPNDSVNALYVEGELATAWTPTSAYKTELVTTLAHVEDGHLTLSAQDSTITEMQFVEIRELPDLTPDDAREAPEDYAAFVAPRAVSAGGETDLGVNGGVLPVDIDPTADVVLGINVVDGRGGALLESLSDGSIRLYETLTGIEVPYSANTTGGFDSLTVAPTTDLKEYTSYTLVIDGFQDRGDNDNPDAPTREFQKFSTTFVTGEKPEVIDREVHFEDTLLLSSNAAAGEQYTSIEMSPDKAFLYVTSLSGTITRWDVNGDGSIDQSTKEVFTPGGDFDIDGGRRGIIGIAFDPEDENVIWITDNYPVPLNGRSNSVPDFSGRISKVTLGENGSLADAEIETYVTGLPRSNGDHVTNSLEFRLNPDYTVGGDEPQYLLYLTQGSNSAMGEPDSAWGFRPERLLNAAILEVDRSRDAPPGGFDITTEPLPDNGLNRRFADSDGDLKNGGIFIDSGEYTGNYLHFTEQGVAEVRVGADATSALIEEFYNPYEEDAVVKIFAEGNRNAYDLVWHSNGYLYVSTNGSAAGGNVPDDPSTPQNENVNGVGLQSDYLFRMVEGGYYGHPNPLRDKFILNGGNPTSGSDPNEVGNYPVGTQPDEDYDLEGSYSLQNNKSPNGAIEYVSNTFGSSLQNAVIFTQYSSGDNLRAVLFNEDGTVAEDFILRDTDGNIISYVDPLDVIEGADGRLYMLTLNRGSGVSQIIKLDAAPGGTIADETADVGGDLALIVVNASNPESVVFQVVGLDPDIESITVSFNGGPEQTVTLAGSQFAADVSAFDGDVTATLSVEDDDGNTADTDVTFTPGDPGTGGTVVIDAIEFQVLSDLTGSEATVVRRIDDPSTYEAGNSNDANGDGLNDNYDGTGYLDPNGGPEDKASFTYTASAPGTYTFVFRMANGDGAGAPRPIAIKTGDQVVTIADTQTGSFTNWQDFEITLTLETGVNTIVIEQTGTGAPNIDSISVTPDVIGGPNDGTEVVGGVTYNVYEAENADLIGGPDIVSDTTDERNQRGGEFVDFDGTTEQAISWTVTAGEAGNYGIDILYALSTAKEARPATLTVNGVELGTLPFSPNSNAAENVWGPQSAEVQLNAGTNFITITVPDANGANIDYLRVTQEPVDTFVPTYAAIDDDGRIELEATNGTTRIVSDTTAEFYFTVADDDTYALDLAANVGAANGAGLTVFLSANGGVPVEVSDSAFPGVGDAGETSAYVELAAGVQYKLTVVSDQPGASDLDYLDVRLAPGDENADIEIQSLDPVFYDNRLHFSWLDNDSASNPDRSFKSSATVAISNSGSANLEVLETTLSGPFELADPDIFDGLTLAPGQSINVEVLFDRSAYTAGGNGATGVFTGELQIRTNDADSPVATVDLAGFWQAQDEGGWEPNLNEVWRVFGFGNEIEGLTQQGGGQDDELDFYDVYLQQDEDEVLSPYWKLADGVTQATITQLAAYHGGGGATLGIHAPGNKNSDITFTNHAGDNNQRILPVLSNGQFATANFTNGTIPDGWAGNDIFGIEVAGLSTDPTLNPTGEGSPSQAELDAQYPGYTVDAGGNVFDPDGNPVPDGYTVRMYQAVDADGQVIDNVFLGVMDYTGINYDYNDNMFIIEGITPVFDGAVATITGLDDAAADDRLVFSRIDNPANGNQAFRDQATFTITNDGIGALAIESVAIEGEFVVSGLSAGTSLAPGQSANVTVTFTGTDPNDNNAAVLYEGSLVIGTSAGEKAIALSGLAQIQSEGGEEPTVAQIVEAFGYSTDVAQGELANGGIVEAVGDEILLPYMVRLDSDQPVEVIQIAAYLSAGVGRLSLHDVESGDLTQLYAQDDNQYQTLLPDQLIAGPGAQNGVARATIDSDDPFGLKVTVDGRPTYSAWTDPNANLADDTFNLPSGNEGHYIRFFQALDANGEAIEGTFIGIQDYPGGENFDYNDHMFVIKNVQAYTLSAAEDANGDGVNDALVNDDDEDGVPDFFDPDFTPPAGPQTAFNSGQVPWAIDGDGLTLMASLFDNGGQGVAYNDDGQKQGDQSVRAGTNVDISNGTGAIGYTAAGEWLEYTINVEQAGTYQLTFNSSSPVNGRALTATFAQNGVVYEEATSAIPNTGAYTTYQDSAPQTVTLNAGVQVLRVNFDVNQQDLMSFTLTPDEILQSQSPFPGPDAPLLEDSLTVDATNFDNGGQGVSWNDNPGRDGTHALRADTDVELVGGEADIGFILPDEWVEYTVDVAEAGSYLLSVNAKTPIGGNSIEATLDDGTPLAIFDLPDSNGASNSFTGTTFAQTPGVAIDLEAGEQTLRFTFDGDPATNGFILDFRSFTLETNDEAFI